MQKIQAQSFGFHLAALALLGLGLLLAVLGNLDREPDIILVNVDGQVVESRVIARGLACPVAQSEPEEPSPVRGYSPRVP